VATGFSLCSCRGRDNRESETSAAVELSDFQALVGRHAAELEEKLEYISQNPVKRGLTSYPDRYEWLVIKSITG
jgi:hypothetical protein